MRPSLLPRRPRKPLLGSSSTSYSTSSSSTPSSSSAASNASAMVRPVVSTHSMVMSPLHGGTCSPPSVRLLCDATCEVSAACASCCSDVGRPSWRRSPNSSPSSNRPACSWPARPWSASPCSSRPWLHPRCCSAWPSRSCAVLGPVAGLARRLVAVGRSRDLEQLPQPAGGARERRRVATLDVDHVVVLARGREPACPGRVILCMMSSCWPRRQVLLTRK